jgi:hypothetical protein
MRGVTAAQKVTLAARATGFVSAGMAGIMTATRIVSVSFFEQADNPLVERPSIGARCYGGSNR